MFYNKKLFFIFLLLRVENKEFLKSIFFYFMLFSKVFFKK